MSVASGLSVVQPHSLPPVSRSPSGPDNQNTPSPFSMLLDATSPLPEPPPPPRADARPDRNDDPPPADDRSAPAPSRNARDDQPVRDCKDSGNNSSAQDSKVQDSKDGSAAKDPTKDAAADNDKSKQDATIVVDAAANALTSGDAVPQSANAAPVMVAQPVQAPVNVTPVEVTAEAEFAAAASGALAAPGTKADAKADAKGDAKNANRPDAAAGKPDAKTADKLGSAQGDTPLKPLPLKGQAEAGSNENPAGSTDHAANHRHAPEARTLTAAPDAAAQIANPPAAANAAANAAQSIGGLQAAAPSHAPAAAQSLPGTAPAAAVPLAGVAVEIVSHAQAGKNRFEIRLDPPELGRIDVQLDVDRDGNVTSRLVVDRAETLDLLRRDASQIERALQQAGLKTGDNSLEFSLRGHAFGRDDQPAPQQGTRMELSDDNDAPLEAMRQGYGRHLGLGGGIDIRV